MKTYLPILAVLALAGCYSPRQFPLQPGEAIIFQSTDRANEFRAQSNNDRSHSGRVVEIDKPTWVSCE